MVELSNPRKLRVCHFKVCTTVSVKINGTVHACIYQYMVMHVCTGTCIYMYTVFSVQKNSEICTYSYPDTILSVKLSRQVR